MTIQRKGSSIRRVGEIAIGSALSLALLAGTPLLQSCGGNESDTETVQRQETTFSKGVKTYITETAPGQFKITDEVPTSADSAVAIVRYYDGHRDTLTAASAKSLIDNEVAQGRHVGGTGSHFSLGNALLYGGMGYFLASSLNNNRYAGYRQQYGGSGYYANSAAYNRSQSVGREISASRSTRTVTTTRPRSGRSGFFGRSGSRSFGG
ncbi:MAG: hypothetical protein H7Y12_02525 [Sphingobacteriaceae bacterium]|nr:hypothetical protein [Cytophagaceae bacterium]